MEDLGNDSHDYVNGTRVRQYEDGHGADYQNPERGIFQSRWMDLCKQKMNSMPDEAEYINYTYRPILVKSEELSTPEAPAE